MNQGLFQVTTREWLITVDDLSVTFHRVRRGKPQNAYQKIRVDSIRGVRWRSPSRLSPGFLELVTDRATSSSWTATFGRRQLDACTAARDHLERRVMEHGGRSHLG
ncbi:hypothetical protein CFP65_6975 [Kitasatospora sp. MMS16-BH015]|uniref:hypothetical protein n=1 Tax=Kitasatospora sp. MMS16-BH015 TaxID=2018025 RepID=UPI000CA19539|nr:hypothetical protein [Kitasatospora sp. MMS16-BH015]AUG81587.1 hypothetical protein CFP65_6975 [Kitasatospora sp. MMS16-BH015]